MNAAVEIVPVNGRRQLDEFIRVAWTVNSGDPNWVPPLVHDRKKLLDPSQNPFFKDNPYQLFLAIENGRPAGRVAAMVNHSHNQRYGDKTGFFGFFEAVNNREVAADLLGAAEEWLRGRGCDTILGPVCPDTNNELGVLVDGYDSPPFFMLAHNPPYYREVFEGLGYVKARDFYSYWLSCSGFIAEGKLRRVQSAIMKRYPITIRAGNIHRLESELELIGDIYNDAFAHHWGFVPMTRQDIRFFANDVRLIMDPELVLFAEYAGEPAGFLLALPNINETLIKIRDGRLYPFGWLTYLRNRSKIKGVRVLTIGVKQKFQSFGLGSVFYPEIHRRICERGYTHAEMSWIVEDNVMMNRAAQLLGGHVYKTYRLFQKGLV